MSHYTDPIEPWTPTCSACGQLLQPLANGIAHDCPNAPSGVTPLDKTPCVTLLAQSFDGGGRIVLKEHYAGDPATHCIGFTVREYSWGRMHDVRDYPFDAEHGWTDAIIAAESDFNARCDEWGMNDGAL